MIARWEAGTKVVLAARRDRHGDPWTTRLFAGLFNWLFKKLVFDGFSPQGIGFFLVDRQVVDLLVRCNEKNAHLIGLILWSGYRYEIVEYDRVEREHGTSRWTFRKKLKYFIDAFAAFSYLPLRLASALGLFLAAVGGLYAVVVVIVRLLNEVPVPGWTALMVVVLLVSGAQLLILGILGEYLWRNFDATRRRPLFIVETMIGSGDSGDICCVATWPERSGDFKSGETSAPGTGQTVAGQWSWRWVFAFCLRLRCVFGDSASGCPIATISMNPPTCWPRCSWDRATSTLPIRP